MGLFIESNGENGFLLQVDWVNYGVYTYYFILNFGKWGTEGAN